MNTVITGGFGLIGSEFLNGVKLKKSDYNLTIAEEVKQMYQDLNPDIVIHTAAKVGGIRANMDYKADFFYENIMMNTNIIHYAKEYKVKKLLCFLSTCIFPDSIDYPLNESKINLGPPHSSNYAYAYAKRMSQVQIESYNEQYGTNFFSVIPTNVFGPNDNYNLELGHVIPSIIHKCYNAISNKTNLVLWGDGSPLREFIYSKDVSKICEILIEKYNGTNPLIISTSEEYSIKDITNLIIKIMGFKGKIIWDVSKPNGQLRKNSDNSNLIKEIGNFEFTPIEKGLEETISFFEKNFDNIRK